MKNKACRDQGYNLVAMLYTEGSLSSLKFVSLQNFKLILSSVDVL